MALRILLPNDLSNKCKICRRGKYSNPGEVILIFFFHNRKKRLKFSCTNLHEIAWLDHSLMIEHLISTCMFLLTSNANIWIQWWTDLQKCWILHQSGAAWRHFELAILPLLLSDSRYPLDIKQQLNIAGKRKEQISTNS